MVHRQRRPLADPYRPDPRRRLLDLPRDARPYDQHGDDEHQRFGGRVKCRVSQDPLALGLDLARVADDGHHAEPALVFVDRQREPVQRLVAGAHDFADALWMLLNEVERVERLRQPLDIGGRDPPALVVVDRHAEQPFLIAVPLDDTAEVGLSIFREQGPDRLDEAFGQRRDAALEFGPAGCVAPLIPGKRQTPPTHQEGRRASDPEDGGCYA